MLGTKRKNPRDWLVLWEDWKKVAELVDLFGMNLIYFSKNRDYELEKRGIRFLELNDLLKQSDVISLHCDLNDKTRNILNESI